MHERRSKHVTVCGRDLLEAHVCVCVFVTRMHVHVLGTVTVHSASSVKVCVFRPYPHPSLPPIMLPSYAQVWEFVMFCGWPLKSHLEHASETFKKADQYRCFTQTI